MVAVCHCCGQPLRDVREGVRLTPLKARIFDLIKARPGITRKEIAWMLYESCTETEQNTTASHIYQLRDKFIGTGLDISGVSGNGYRIRKG